MIPGSFEYFAPTSVDEALALLKKMGKMQNCSPVDIV